MQWKRVNHWKNIRMLVDGDVVRAYIQRGRRPHEYTIVFPKEAYSWTIRHQLKSSTTNTLPDYTLQDSDLATAKAVGLLIVKTG